MSSLGLLVHCLFSLQTTPWSTHLTHQLLRVLCLPLPSPSAPHVLTPADSSPDALFLLSLATDTQASQLFHFQMPFCSCLPSAISPMSTCLRLPVIHVSYCVSISFLLSCELLREIWEIFIFISSVKSLLIPKAPKQLVQ